MPHSRSHRTPPDLLPYWVFDIQMMGVLASRVLASIQSAFYNSPRYQGGNGDHLQQKLGHASQTVVRQNDRTWIPEEGVTLICGGCAFESRPERMLNCFDEDGVGRYPLKRPKNVGVVARQVLRVLLWHPAFCLFSTLGLHILVVQMAEALDDALLLVVVTFSAVFEQHSKAAEQSGLRYPEVHHRSQQAERVRWGYASGGRCLEEGKGNDRVCTFGLDL